MNLNEWNIEQAVNSYFSNAGDLSTLCPPQTRPKPVSSTIPRKNSGVVLSCGHVEANFPAISLNQILDLLNVISAGAMSPVHTDGDYGEFTWDNLTLLLSMKDIQKIKI